MSSVLAFFPAHAQPTGCESAKCHVNIEPMHVSTAVRLACAECHGGNPDTTDKLAGHIQPRNKSAWPTSANPVRNYAELNHESPEFIRFRNPGDLRIADQTCGRKGCHVTEVAKVRTSLMTHGAFLWGAALYNNGGFPLKRPVFGESYSREGIAQKLAAVPPPTASEIKLKAMLPELWPLPQFEATQPGNTLRAAHPPARSPALLHGHQRPAWRLSLFGLHRMPCGVRQRPRPQALRSIRLARPPGVQLHRRSHHP
ncbi:hypothetical protein SBA4_5860003 [Candidatus Sulfopaludibacter sp. SbA4]|nr:hypothetical protein SBA4_5860003 [Candidatus Sulfopaludibacter sp. SbA4]